MRRLLLTFALFLCFGSFAQICEIDMSQNSPGLYPDTLPIGIVGQPYNTDITFVMPTDTMGYNFTNFKILSVALPVGLSWQCDASVNQCNYNPQVTPSGCVNVAGTPLLAGQYNVDVTVIADLTVLQGVTVVFQVYFEVLPNNVEVTNDGFSTVGAAGCLPVIVQFVNNNPGLEAYFWDFGNGNTSTVENPSPQVYTEEGEYIVNYTAWNNTENIDVYTLTNVTVNSMSGYGGGFPSFENADAYFILRENGNIIYQSSVIMDTDPPVSWSVNIILNDVSSYSLEIWEGDESVGEWALGADDYMGYHILMLTGCSNCAVTGGDSGSGATVAYSITHDIVEPTPVVVSVGTVSVYGYPEIPNIVYNDVTNIFSTNDMGLAYQWYFNGSPIGGATSTSYQATLSGNYYVVAINNNGCVSFSEEISVVICLSDYVPLLSYNNGTITIVNYLNEADIVWSVNGTIVSGQNGTSITVVEYGEYSVELTDEFGCSYSSFIMNVNLSIEDNAILNWNLYPNPANDIVTIQVNSNITVNQVTMTDLTGRVVKTIPWNEGSNLSFDVSELPSGMYVVTVQGNNTQWTKRLIKE